MNDFPWLSAITLLPLAGAILMLTLDHADRALHKTTALVVSGVTLAIAGLLWLRFDIQSAALQFEQRVTWIPSLGVEYHLGVDGLGIVMVILAALLVPFSLLLARGDEGRGYFSLILFLEGGLLGTFTAQNFIHWFVFWELALIPAFFLIKGWGGPKADRAALQFFIYTMVGSIALLLAFLALYLAAGRLPIDQRFDFGELAQYGKNGQLAAALSVSLGFFDAFRSEHGLAVFVFLLAFLGLAVKLPIWPFHTWLPATYSEAPTPVTMLLTGAMSKMGAYGLLRILLPIFPNEMRLVLTPLLWLAVASIVFGAGAALMQKDLKRVLAYSSINHLGYVALAVFAASASGIGSARLIVERSAALNGAVLQMFNHGITAAALFGFLSLLERRTGGIRGIDEFGGLRKIVPVFTGLMGISIFASLGLPGLNGFVGEFLIFKGVFALTPWAAVLATLGLLFTAWFYLNVLQKVFSGPLNERWKSFPDLTSTEIRIMLPATLLMFLIGIWPQWVVELINETMKALALRL